MPYTPEIGNTYDCLYCEGLQIPSAEDLLSHLSLGVITETRENQIKLARLIDKTLVEKSILVAEAGTGVGKSFAYLLPAILSGKRTLVSTAKKSLQDQLVKKDLPYLQSKLKGYVDFKFAPAYGKNNYACQREVYKKIPKASHRVWQTFFRKSHTGHWDEATNSKITRRAALTAENCDTFRCNYKSNCGYLAAREEVNNADIIVANHWVTGYHLKTTNALGYQGMLGNIDYLIVDEAHKYEDGVRNAFTSEIREDAIAKVYEYYDSALTTMLDPNMPDELPFRQEIAKEWTALFSQVRASQEEHSSACILGAQGIRLRTALAKCLHLVASPNTLAAWLRTTVTFADTLIDSVLVTATTPSPSPQDLESALGSLAFDSGMAWPYIEILINSLNDLVTTLDTAEGTEAKTTNNVVIYVENIGKYCAIRLAPIDIAQHAAVGHYLTAATVYTSATLAVNNSLNVFSERVGVADPITAQFGSAFDVNKQARLYLPKDIPLPTRVPGAMDEYRDKVADEILNLITANNGDAFVLFTARDEMKAIHALISNKAPMPIVMQGSGNAAAVLKQFRDTPNAVAFGLKSFWEGIDVTGEKLSLVVISKLPFPGKSDPILVAKRAHAGTHWFHKVDLPDMILDLRQGIGRLIRSKTDRGIVAILDPRILTKRYSQKTLRSLGFAKYVTNKQTVLTALNNLAKQRT